MRNNNYIFWRAIPVLRHHITVFFIIICCSYSGFTQAFNPIEINGKWGFVDENNDIVIDTLYVLARAFNSHGIAPVVDDSGWVYIDTCGNKLFRPFIFDNGPDYFVEGLARFQDGDKIGFVNDRGEIKIEARFTFIRPFSEGLAAFCSECQAMFQGEHQIHSGGKWGYINKKGKTIIPAQFEKAFDFKDNIAWIVTNGEKKRIDANGNLLD